MVRSDIETLSGPLPETNYRLGLRMVEAVQAVESEHSR